MLRLQNLNARRLKNNASLSEAERETKINRNNKNSLGRVPESSIANKNVNSCITKRGACAHTCKNKKPLSLAMR